MERLQSMARNLYHLLGTSPEGIPSAILSETINLGSGGDIILNTHQLIVRDGQFRGVVEINTPEVDPSQSLIDLPQGIQRPNQIEPICRPEWDSETPRLTQTGRGLPSTPAQLLDLPGSLVDFITPLPTSTQGNSWGNSDRSRPSSPTAEVISATGWVINAQGKVFLTAISKNITLHPPISPDAECPPKN